MTMRRKVSTLLPESLYRRVKVESIRQGKQISEILGEALESYLDEKKNPPGIGGAVAGSWAALRVNRKTLSRLLDEEEGLLDA
jgi:metal-responsive CopG/Arc/MetJ family transcriptional regulator